MQFTMFNLVPSRPILLGEGQSKCHVSPSLSLFCFQVFIGVPALLVLIAAFLVVMPVVDNPQVRSKQQVVCPLP